jgi:predicted ArsR family transcriptional regulator
MTPAGDGDLTATTRTVVAVFTEMGFDPAITARSQGNRINLRACPFRALAEQHRAVVCRLHLGLLKEIVEQAGARTVSAELSPFVRPDLCIADLGQVSHW